MHSNIAKLFMENKHIMKQESLVLTWLHFVMRRDLRGLEV